MRKRIRDKRAVSLEDINRMTFETIGFDGEWLEAFGDPEKTGCWVIWGESGSGKTTYVMKIAKYLISRGLRTAYNTLEEGISESFKQALRRSGIASECKSRFTVWDKMEYSEMISRIKRRRSPDVIIIDSIQFLAETGFTKAELQNLLNDHPNKLFIFVSWAKGTQPSGALASACRFKSNIKMFVRQDGYIAIDSRYRGKTLFDAWPEKHFEPKTPNNNEQQAETD